MAGIGVPGDDADMSASARHHRRHIPRPSGDPEAPLQALVTNLDASDYLGRLAIGRVVQGTLRAGDHVALCQADPGRAARSPPAHRRCSGSPVWAASRVDERAAGDLFVVAGFPEVEIGDTLADPDDPQPLPRLEVDEPVLRMTFGVNTSPLAGRTVRYLTSRQIRERLEREVLGNVSIRLGPTSSPEVIEVAGRGELQLAVLIESMRREGFEFQVSRPEVILREIDGAPHEPVERAVIDVPDEHVGTVTQAVAPRKGKVIDLRPGDAGRTIVTLEAPARGLLGFRSLLMTATRGTALIHQHHAGWMPWAGELPHRHGGAMISDRRGRRHRVSPSTTCRSGASCSSARATRSTRAWSSARLPPRGAGRQPDQGEAADQHPHPSHRRGDQAEAAPQPHARDRHRVDRRRRAGRGHPQGDPGPQTPPHRERSSPDRQTDRSVARWQRAGRTSQPAGLDDPLEELPGALLGGPGEDRARAVPTRAPRRRGSRRGRRRRGRSPSRGWRGPSSSPRRPGRGPVEHLAHQLRVEGRGDLVEQQHLGVADQRPHDRRPAAAGRPTAARGTLARARPARAGRAPRVARPSASAGATFCALRGPRVTLSSTLMWGNRLNDWNTMPIRRRTALAFAPGPLISTPSSRITAAVDRFEQVDAAQQGRLARAARPDEAHDLVLGDGEVDVVEHDLRAVRLGELLDLELGRRSAGRSLIRPPGLRRAVPLRAGSRRPRQRERERQEQHGGGDVGRVVEVRDVMICASRTASRTPSTLTRATSFCRLTTVFISAGSRCGWPAGGWRSGAPATG